MTAPMAEQPADQPAPLDHASDPLPVQRYKLTLAYDGSAFHGWQKQRPVPTAEDPSPTPVRTVGGVVEDALQRLLRHGVRLVGASRTDAGVHAQGQVAHFDSDTAIPLDRFPHAINSRLPDDVEVVRVEPVAAEFDAISDAVRKQYRYRVFHTPRRPLHRRNFVWHCWTDLNLAAMSDAAGRLIGTHDFAGFAAAGHGRSSTVRTIFRCEVEHQSPEVVIVVEGSGFLYNMVRIIAGTLIEVGRGRFDSDVVERVIRTGERREAGPTLPAQGLSLEWIEYGPPGTGRPSSPQPPRD